MLPGYQARISTEDISLTIGYNPDVDLRAIPIAIFLVALPAPAQWLKMPSPGIPRTADGKPNLTAPAPKTADGKPDLSGIWRQPNGVKYTINLAADLKPGDVVMTPWAAELYKQRQDNLSKDDPVGYCQFPACRK